jgi:hypothetical protein
VRVSEPKLGIWDAPPPGERVEAHVEKAYRRGFHQGACAAVEAMEDGASLVVLTHWLGQLHAWRLSGLRWQLGQSVVAKRPPSLPPTTSRRTA